MTKMITTFADFDVDNNDNPMGAECSNRIETPVYPISEEDALNFEEAIYEEDMDSLREAEADAAWMNLKDTLNTIPF